MSDSVKRIAMWSGPRNVSTALMRSFENRDDCVVIDEPLYAHWLQLTGTDHPGRDEVMRTHECDWRRVVEVLLAPLPSGKSVFYQKHMAHHLTDDIERGWIGELDNVFLLREPEAMLTSLIKVVPSPGLLETGLLQQLELFRDLQKRAGRTPPVIDSQDLLEDPAGLLAELCEYIGIAFDENMLAWPPGPRETDGAWASHWYGSVEKSRGFEPYQSKDERVPERLESLLRDCRVIYEELYRERITTG